MTGLCFPHRACVIALLTLATVTGGPRTVQAGGAAGPARVDATRLAAADAEPGQWMAHGRTWAEQRFSPLADVHRDNVAELGLAWMVEPGTTRGNEATPLVIDGVMYVTTAWSRVLALDAASGAEIWRYDPEVPGAKARDGCCDVVNRGVAAWNNRLYLGAFDGRLICLDAASGRPLWQVQTTDPDKPYTITGAPRVLRDLVLIGNGGAEFGVRGYVSAYDADTGELRWRFYTVPASHDGPHEHPELADAARTWSPRSMWETGLGGTVWDSMAYDPELDLLYVGTGNASIYNRELRSPGGGDNLFVASILALDPEDGHLVWHYQEVPGEHWDYTATQHIVLADLEIGGRRRKVLLQAPKNGFFYVLDRSNGELISAEPYVDVSWATHVDRGTGRPVPRPQAVWTDRPAIVTPGIPGGHNWHPMAFSPDTGLVYIPTFTSVYGYHPDREFRFLPGLFNTAEAWGEVAAEFEGIEEFVRYNASTELTAWDPIAARAVWQVDHGQGIPAGVLATAGGLVFQGTTDGRLAAYDDRDGTLLWQTETGTGVIAPPVTYSVDGEQYVAVIAGLGGSQGGHYTRIPNANTGRILAYRLGSAGRAPAVAARPVRAVEAPALEASPEELARGRDLYSLHCARCHGLGVASSGLYPDLRYASAGVHAIWDPIVRGGLLQARGMASFADILSVEDARAVQAYVVARAHQEPGWLQWLAEQAAGRLRIPPSWLVD